LFCPVEETGLKGAQLIDQTVLRVRDYVRLGTMGPHEHDSPSLNVIVSGGFRDRVGQRHRDFTRGHAIFCPAGVSHSQAFGARGARQVIISPKAEWLEYLVECKVRLEDTPHVRSVQLAEMGDRLVHEIETDDVLSPLACDGLVLEIVAAFGRGSCIETRHLGPAKWLLAARDFLHANSFGPVGLAMVAEAAGRHPMHLCREFRRHFGISVAGYVRRLRIEEAKRLIDAGGLGLSEIALETGFNSHAHLCREFRAQTGLSPSQYRMHGRN
jgi:AraC family transcriptional regulator